MYFDLASQKNITQIYLYLILDLILNFKITSNNDYYITLTGALVVGSPSTLAGNYSVQVRAANGPFFVHQFVVETDGDPRKVGEFRMLYAPEDVEYAQGRTQPFTLHAGDGQGLLLSGYCEISNF
jgi:hypothetical protein